jgi:hypothetical protein
LYGDHAAQLWQPVKVQTFFRERRYVRYFIVQEQKEQGEQDAPEQQQGDEQRLALLSSKWEALKRKDGKAINRIAKDALAKDRIGWFKRTRWDEHLQAYTDWKLLAYAIRLPGDDEPALRQVVLAVEEQAVCGLGTLSVNTLRWPRSAKQNEPDVRPLSKMQNKGSQQRAARLLRTSSSRKRLCRPSRTSPASSLARQAEAGSKAALQARLTQRSQR